MTVNGVTALILPYFAEFGSFSAQCVNVVEDITYRNFLRQKCSPLGLVFGDISLTIV